MLPGIMFIAGLLPMWKRKRSEAQIKFVEGELFC
jgi:hypothetical protein